MSLVKDWMVDENGFPDDYRDPEVCLHFIWNRYFADIEQSNPIVATYAKPWKSRLGTIQLVEGVSQVKINLLLQNPQVPLFVLIITIAHELTHYVHGFGSRRPQLYEHPHANDVVTKELEARGLGRELRLCKEWIDLNWYVFYEKNGEQDV